VQLVLQELIETEATEQVGAFRTRPLDHIEFAYVYLDTTYLHVRNQTSQVTSMAVVVATGITSDGSREILGCDIGDSEDETLWRGFLRSMKARGLGGVKLVISDQHAGLVAALRRSFQGAAHQRCRVHFARNLLALVPKSHSYMVAAVFRTIFAQPDAQAVSSTWDEVRDQLVARFPKIGPLMDTARVEVLAFTSFPRAHWQKIWSTNPLERINKEIRRLTCRGDLPQRGCRDPPRRSRARRHARRMASRRPPLPLRRLIGVALPPSAILSLPPSSTAATEHRGSTSSSHHSAGYGRSVRQATDAAARDRHVPLASTVA